MRRLGLAGRLILLGLLAAWLVAICGGLLLRASVRDASIHGFQLRLDERAARIEARFSVADDGGVVYVEPRVGDDFARIFSGWYWRLHGDGVLLRSRSLWDSDITLAANDGGAVLHAARGPSGERLLGLSRGIEIEGRTLQLDVYGPDEQVSDAMQHFDRLLLAILAALFVLMLGTAVLQASLGLRPLSRLRTRVAAVQGGGEARVGEGFGPDLDPLAVELDTVLARNARVVARARSHAADLAHALKKPLALLGSASGQGHAQVPAELVRRETANMARLIDRHLARAGSGAGERRRVTLAPRVQALIELMRQIHAERGLDWSADVAADVSWRGEVTDLEEMLGNLLDNAGKWARRTVRLAARMHDSELHVHIDDDGPGLSAAQYTQALERGRRFDESVEGSGLGLAIVCDIAETYDGRLDLAASPAGGLRATLALPA